MKRIESFSINHDTLEKGMYVSRIDRDVTTYDIRMVKPNCGTYLSNAAMHTFEHLFATYVRNTPESASIIYVGPMGCRTGFYFLTRGLTDLQTLNLVRDTLIFISGFSGEIPGARRRECGNYLEHDLDGARAIARDMQPVLKDWTQSDMAYRE